MNKNNSGFKINLFLLVILCSVITFAMDSSVASEFRVNQFTDFPTGEAAEDPAIATDSNNHIIITWEDPRYSKDNVLARIFDNTGNPLTNDFRVDQSPDIGSDPSIAVDSDNHVIITWEETRGNDDIFVRIFDSTGNPLTNEYRVDQDLGTNEAGQPVIATDGNNNFIIAWTDYRNGNGDIFARRFNINGAPLGNEFRIDQDTVLNHAETPKIATDSNNNFIITWMDYRSGHADIFARIFNNNGVPLSDEFRVNQFTDFSPGEEADDPAIATDSNNHIIITWEDPRFGEDNVFARIFDNTGNPLTNDFRVDQSPDIGSNPSIAVDSDNHIIITWEETRENGDIFVRIFDSTGKPLTNEYRVAQDIETDEAAKPVIATDGNNNLVIAWTDYRSGHGDIFAATVNKPAPDIKANNSDGPLTITQGDNLSVTVKLDAAGNANNADWWVVADTAFLPPSDWYYYNLVSDWRPSLSVTYQGPLFNLDPYQVLNRKLPPGHYTFYFGVDMIMNGVLNMGPGEMYYDKVDVTITP